MPTDKILTKSVEINSTTEKVWHAMTSPVMIKQWLFGTNVITDWKVGSPILFTGSWQGTEYKDKGTILQFDREKVFQYNYWSSFSGLPDSEEIYSIITFKLDPSSEGTRLTLMQSHFPTEAGYEQADKNWDSTLAFLKKIIEEQMDLPA